MRAPGSRFELYSYVFEEIWLCKRICLRAPFVLSALARNSRLTRGALRGRVL
jgi:hypothetical protein